MSLSVVEVHVVEVEMVDNDDAPVVHSLLLSRIVFLDPSAMSVELFVGWNIIFLILCTRYARSYSFPERQGPSLLAFGSVFARFEYTKAVGQV